MIIDGEYLVKKITSNGVTYGQRDLAGDKCDLVYDLAELATTPFLSIKLFIKEEKDQGDSKIEVTVTLKYILPLISIGIIEVEDMEKVDDKVKEKIGIQER